MHRRKVVRDAMISVIKDAVTNAGQNVFGHRAWGLNADEIPCVRVFQPDETVIPGQSMGEDGDRVVRMTVRVEAVIEASNDADDQVDELCEQIEAAIRTHPTLGGVCQWCQLKGAEIDFEDESRTVMVAANDYEVVV